MESPPDLSSQHQSKEGGSDYAWAFSLVWFPVLTICVPAPLQLPPALQLSWTSVHTPSSVMFSDLHTCAHTQDKFKELLLLR